MSELIYKNNELENEVSSDMSYFWYSDIGRSWLVLTPGVIDSQLTFTGIGKEPGLCSAASRSFVNAWRLSY